MGSSRSTTSVSPGNPAAECKRVAKGALKGPRRSIGGRRHRRTAGFATSDRCFVTSVKDRTVCFSRKRQIKINYKNEFTPPVFVFFRECLYFICCRLRFCMLFVI